MLLRHLIHATAAAAYAVTGSVRPTESLPNVSILDARCTVSLSDASHTYTAPIRGDGEFHFHDVDAGSYLLSTHCPSHAFLPLRVDVGQSQSATSRSQLDAASPDAADAAAAESEDVVVYRTTRGGEWNAVLGRETYPIGLVALGTREYYATAQSFSVGKLLRNPMVLLGIFGAFTVFVMPQLVQWLDPEGAEEMHRIRAEKAKEAANARPKDNPVEKLQNFDVSGWLAGKQK